LIQFVVAVWRWEDDAVAFAAEHVAEYACQASDYACKALG